MPAPASMVPRPGLRRKGRGTQISSHRRHSAVALSAAPASEPLVRGDTLLSRLASDPLERPVAHGVAAILDSAHGLWAVVSAEVEQAIELSRAALKPRRWCAAFSKTSRTGATTCGLSGSSSAASRRTRERPLAGDLFAGRCPRHAPEGRRTPGA